MKVTKGDLTNLAKINEFQEAVLSELEDHQNTRISPILKKLNEFLSQKQRRLLSAPTAPKTSGASAASTQTFPGRLIQLPPCESVITVAREDDDDHDDGGTRGRIGTDKSTSSSSSSSSADDEVVEKLEQKIDKKKRLIKVCIYARLPTLAA